MANPIEFDGWNCLFRGNGETVSDLHTFKNRGMIVSAWSLTPEELEEVNRTGLVWLGIVGQGMPPVIVGSRAVVRGLVADYGEVWR